MTTVSEAILSRRSIRAFLDKPVAPDLIQKIITQSARAPSGGNLQPWYVDVVTGDSHKKLLDLMDKKIVDNPAGETRDYDFYPSDLPDKYTNRRRATGAGLYEAMGIAYDDKQVLYKNSLNFTKSLNQRKSIEDPLNGAYRIPEKLFEKEVFVFCAPELYARPPPPETLTALSLCSCPVLPGP